MFKLCFEQSKVWVLWKESGQAKDLDPFGGHSPGANFIGLTGDGTQQTFTSTSIPLFYINGAEILSSSLIDMDLASVIAG